MIDKEVKERLVTFGIKPSARRVAIMKCLAEHRTHPTVEDIYQWLHPSIPTLSRTTVYNTLKMFSDFGAASLLTIDDHRVCYDGEIRPHAHFYCKKCGKVIDIETVTYPTLPKDLKTHGHKVTEQFLIYKGFCNECISKENNTN